MPLPAPEPALLSGRTAAVIVAGGWFSRWNVGATGAFLGGTTFAAADIGAVGVIAIGDDTAVF